MNPVVLLDEVDKVGSDYRGDPAAALLEVLDPAQNHTFRDHYLEVDLDLSRRASSSRPPTSLEAIPEALLDRMEVVRLDGYTEDEKVAIARDHLLPRQLERAGLTADEVVLTDEALRGGRGRAHPRGGRPAARARSREDPPQGRRAARGGHRDAHRSRSTSRASAPTSAGRASRPSPPSGPPCPASPPASPSPARAATCSSSRSPR